MKPDTDRPFSNGREIVNVEYDCEDAFVGGKLPQEVAIPDVISCLGIFLLSEVVVGFIQKKP